MLELWGTLIFAIACGIGTLIFCGWFDKKMGIVDGKKD